MALPLEVSAFFDVLRSIWLLFPLMVRQVFYLSFVIMGVLGFMKSMR